MDFADRHRFVATSSALLLTAVMAFLGTGLHPLWPLLWIAPLPILIMAPRLPATAAFCTGALAWFLGGLNMWRFLSAIVAPPGHSPIPLLLFILAAPAVIFGLALLLWRRLLLSGAVASAALAFPSVWVSYEYINEATSVHGTYGNLAYTQIDFLPIVQLAAVTGVWGITFCLFLLPATVAALLVSEKRGPQRRTLGVGASIFFIGVFAFGLWRIHSTPAARQSVRVGLLASDRPQNVYPQEPGPDTERLLRDYTDQAAELARAGAEVIVLPEKLGVVVDPATRETDASLQAFADRSRANIVAGLIRVANPLKFNEARIYIPASTTVLSYDKEHMLPAFESKLQPGTARLLMRRPSGIWGVAICKDMDFPELSRQYGAAGTGLLLVPAWDFVDDGWLHGRMAVMRGVESGFTIARAARQGVLTVSDNRGRVLAERPSDAAPFATLVADAPVRHVNTLYVRFGNWFAWATLAVLALLLAQLYRTRPVRAVT